MIVKNIYRAIDDFSMLETSSVLVGFSGGADSCALLDVLNNLCKTKSIKLYALHVNHMIRGEEADRDELFCKSFCAERNIPLTIIKKDIPLLAKQQKKGVEECARDFRYACFKEFCIKEGVERIATAHNANDNTETVIFNLARGSGLKGLCGIPPVRDNIIRPLIYCHKEEIVEYCRQKGIEYMKDSTNDCLDYTRNYIRSNIVPQLGNINKEAIGAISRSSVLLRKDLLALEEVAHSFLDASDEVLKKQPDGIISRVLMHRYKNFGYDPSVLEEKHISSLVELFKNGNTADRISLPQKSEAVKEREGIRFCRRQEKPRRVEENFKLHYGVNEISSLGCRVDILTLDEWKKSKEFIEKNQNVYNLSINAEIFFDTIDRVSSMYCRARMDGDGYRFGGMTRSVKKLLWQKGVSAEDRINYPVICDEEGILFLPGFPLREDFNNKSGEKYIISIYFLKT